MSVWGNRIADLPGDFYLGTLKDELIRKCHKTGCLAVSNGTIRFWVKIASFFRLEKLCSDCDGGSIPPETTKQISATRLFSNPALRRNVWPISLQIKPVTARRHGFISLYADVPRVSAEMKVVRGMVDRQ